ncbi:hypothetical protein DPMN_067869 [Dreissena polymorpha]|uniref:DUF6589 domain-containing protein n=1 Tax=Dreissena polymorpha TaxID=45954 RepID=A0A9D3Z1G7_DREPO|nr:hypothetical protein DPMN_067869 [Dreissena polymorpha]
MDFIMFNDAIKSGDIDMITILMKRFIPLFIGLSSYKSKYAVECVNFLTKTECLLSDFESARVKLGLLVNRKGRPGKNQTSRHGTGE